MVRHNYCDWKHYGSEEHCPAAFIELVRPDGKTVIIKDIQAAIDTGSSITAIPIKYKIALELVPSRSIPVRWPNYYSEKEPTYQVILTLDGCKPLYTEIIFDPFHESYALIGRNVLKHWKTILHGPESYFEIEEFDS